MSMTLTQLFEEVVTITNRPDLIAETNYAIKAAITKAHNADEWLPDMSVIRVTPTYSEDLDLYQIFTKEEPFVRFKKALAITKRPVPILLDPVSPDNLFDAYGSMSSNVWYLAGNVINVRTSGLEQAEVTYLTRPDLTETGFTSWIADEHSEVIISGASSIVFDTLGKADEKQRFSTLYLDGIKELRMNYIQGR